ncbi:ISAs1 family transposase [Streptosporangium sp. KLBMP 9127]|nr:ISAs1 family transposase [Streptosporangium sp. KLBMP 9127]
MDGKALRGARLAPGATVHLLAALDHTSGLVLAQTDVDGKTNEITRFQPLLEGIDLDGCVITADALHTQRDHATFRVEQKNAHYVLIVKKNQPTLHTQLKRLLCKHVPIGDRRRDRGHGRDERRTRKVLTVKTGLLFPHTIQAIQIKTPGQEHQERQMADRHRLRHHQPAHPPGRPRRPRNLDPWPPEHRKQTPPRPRRHLR